MKEKYGLTLTRPMTTCETDLFRESSLYNPTNCIYLEAASVSFRNQVNTNASKQLMAMALNCEHANQVSAGLRFHFPFESLFKFSSIAGRLGVKSMWFGDRKEVSMFGWMRILSR